MVDRGSLAIHSECDNSLSTRMIQEADHSTTQAFRKHKVVEVFDEPGSSDLTANVDFAYLKEAMSQPGNGSNNPICQASLTNFHQVCSMDCSTNEISC